MSVTLCRSFMVAGQSVTFFCADSWIAEKIDRLVAGWHFAPLAEPPPSAFRIHLTREPAPPLPRDASRFAIHHGECFVEGESLSLASGDSSLRVHPPADRGVDVWIGAETVASPVAFARLLFYATQAALRRCGLFELHAAAAVSPAGERDGVLIVGASGSGKTTLAMRLTAAGWSNVADDLVLIRDDAHAAEAFAFRRVFAATDETLNACAPARLDEATREPNAFEPLKRRLDPEVLFPGRFAASCTPRVLVFPSITGAQRTESRGLSASDALTRLIRMCPWASYDAPVARPHLSALGRLAQQSVSYELRGGTDLLHDPQAAPQILHALAGAA